MDSKIDIFLVRIITRVFQLYGRCLKRDSEPCEAGRGIHAKYIVVGFVFLTIVTKSITWSIVKYFQWHNNSYSKLCWNSITAKKKSIICKTLARAT